jgi:hypothetical protein
MGYFWPLPWDVIHPESTVYLFDAKTWLTCQNFGHNGIKPLNKVSGFEVQSNFWNGIGKFDLICNIHIQTWPIFFENGKWKLEKAAGVNWFWSYYAHFCHCFDLCGDNSVPSITFAVLAKSIQFSLLSFHFLQLGPIPKVRSQTCRLLQNVGLKDRVDQNGIRFPAEAPVQFTSSHLNSLSPRNYFRFGLQINYSKIPIPPPHFVWLTIDLKWPRSKGHFQRTRKYAQFHRIPSRILKYSHLFHHSNEDSWRLSIPLCFYKESL